MTRLMTISLIGLAAVLAAGCTRIVYDSEAGPVREIKQLTRPGGSIVNIVAGQGMQPDVSFDGTRVAFIREVAGVGQVFAMTIDAPATLQQLTSGAPAKTFPRWSATGRLAYRSGNEIRVLNADFSPFDLGAPPVLADGGLDFYDNGDALVYQRDNNLHVVPLDRSVPEQLITGCPPTASPRCRFPVVSHDQTKLAYLVSFVFGAGQLDLINLVQAGSWTGIGNFALGPALGGGRIIHSFDFSRADNSMYVAARPFDDSTMTYGDDPVLFEVNLDGSGKTQLAPAPVVRYPSAR